VVARVPDALLFDLDGVITDTAAVHARAWKALFDEYLRQLADRGGPPFRAFDTQDYLRYVDGRRRYDGVRTFLESRGLDLPQGSPDDEPGDGTIAALGNRKDDYFRQSLEREGVRAFDDAVALVDAARAVPVPLAVVSASRNCDAVLGRAGLLDRFDARVTGIEAAAWSLPGKPAPDTFLKAAALLAAPPEQCWVLEDAVSGVEAGRAGGFGRVVGVDRLHDPRRLSDAGADVVTDDLRTLIPDLSG